MAFDKLILIWFATFCESKQIILFKKKKRFSQSLNKLGKYTDMYSNQNAGFTWFSFGDNSQSSVLLLDWKPLSGLLARWDPSSHCFRVPSSIFWRNKNKTPKDQQTDENLSKSELMSCQTYGHLTSKGIHLPVFLQQQDNSASGLAGEWSFERTHPQ